MYSVLTFALVQRKTVDWVGWGGGVGVEEDYECVCVCRIYSLILCIPLANESSSTRECI